ncbi:hypothetical protein Tco_1316130 [Tanacetum coccineum]
MQAVRDRQKSYADKRRRPLEFEVGDKVMLKVASWKCVIRFGKRGKLNPRYIGPFQIIERIGPVAYHLELPQEVFVRRSTHYSFGGNPTQRQTQLRGRTRSAKTITTLNEEIATLNNQLSKEKSTISYLQQEKKKLKSDFKICEDKLLDKQTQLENKTEVEPYNDMQQKIDHLQAQLGDLKGKSKDTPCVSDTLDPLSQKLEDENVELEFQLRAQLFDKVSKQQDTTHGTSVNTKFIKQPILRKPSSSSKSKLYSVTPFPNSKVISKVGMFRINPSKTFRVDNVMSNKFFKAIVRTKPITTSQPHVIYQENVNSNSNGISSTGVESTAKTRRPQPSSNTKKDMAPSASKRSCIKNKDVEVEEHHRNLPLSKNKKHMSSECNNVKITIWNNKSKVVCAINSFLNRIMEISKADQIALDDALVAPANRLKIGKCNLRLSSDVTSKEATLQVVYDVLKLTPFYKAFQVSADIQDEDKNEDDENVQDDDDDAKSGDDELKSQDDQDDDDEAQTESEDDGDDFIHPKLTTHDDETTHEEETNEDDTFDPIVHTPSHVSSSDDEDSDNEVEGVDVEGEKSDKDATYVKDQGNEADRDTNDNLEGRDNVKADVVLPQVQETQEIEDTHVTLTPINPDVDIPVTAIAEPSFFAPTNHPPTPTPLFTQLQQPPILTPATTPSSSLQNLPDFGLLFGFDNKLKALEDNFSEFKQTNQYVEALSSITGIVDQYLANKMKEEVDVAVQLKPRDGVDDDQEPSAGTNRGSKRRRSGKEPKSSSALREKTTTTAGKTTTDTGVDAIFGHNAEATSRVNIPVTAIAEPSFFAPTNRPPTPTPLFTQLQQPEILTLATTPSSSLQNLPDFDCCIQLKSDRIREEAQAENQQFLDSIDEGMKKVIKEQVKSEVSKIKPQFEKLVNEQLESEVLVRSSKEAKMSQVDSSTRPGKEPESTNAPREKTTTTAGNTTTGSKTHKQSASQYAPVEETMQSIDVFEAPAHQEFEIGVHDEQTEEEVHPLPDWFQQPKRLPSPEHAMEQISTKNLLSEESHIGARSEDNSMHLRPQGNQLVTSTQKEELLLSQRLQIQDIEDMLLLLVQGKLTNLNIEERLAFNVSLRMFTRSVIIQRRVEDLQLEDSSIEKQRQRTDVRIDDYTSLAMVFKSHDPAQNEGIYAWTNPQYSVEVLRLFKDGGGGS